MKRLALAPPALCAAAETASAKDKVGFVDTQATIFDASLHLDPEYGFIKEPLTDARKQGLVDIVYDPENK